MRIHESQLSSMRGLTGKLTALNGEETVDVELLEFDKSSKEKVAKAILSSNITRENQDLFILSMMIVSKGKDAFLKGQSNWMPTQTGMEFVPNPPSKTRFKGEFDTIIQIGEYMYAIKIVLGNMEFIIDERFETYSETSIVFENVRAILYPYGTYSVQLLDD